MKKIFLILITLLTTALSVFADRYVPEFDKMQSLRCEVSETIYNQGGTVVSTNNYHRLLRFDDESNLLYLQKEPVDKLLSYDKTKVQYKEQSMTDDFIMYSDVVIDRINNEYTSESRIIYDNLDFAPRYAKAKGTCKILN